MLYDNIAKNILDMAAQGHTMGEISVDTGWPLDDISAVLADPAKAVKRYEKKEIPAKEKLVRQIHSAYLPKCENCRWVKGDRPCVWASCMKEVLG